MAVLSVRTYAARVYFLHECLGIFLASNHSSELAVYVNMICFDPAVWQDRRMVPTDHYTLAQLSFKQQIHRVRY